MMTDTADICAATDAFILCLSNSAGPFNRRPNEINGDTNRDNAITQCFICALIPLEVQCYLKATSFHFAQV